MQKTVFLDCAVCEVSACWASSKHERFGIARACARRVAKTDTSHLVISVWRAGSFLACIVRTIADLHWGRKLADYRLVDNLIDGGQAV